MNKHLNLSIKSDLELKTRSHKNAGRNARKIQYRIAKQREHRAAFKFEQAA